MAVTKRTRFEVLRRDNYTCRYCRSTDNTLTVDHVIPAALGGGDAPDNLVACCKDCNAGKSSSSPDESLVAHVEDDAIRWAAARARAIEKSRLTREQAAEVRQPFLTAWRIWDEDGEWLPLDWTESVDGWVAQGIDIERLIDALGLTLPKRHVRHRDVFRYIAGIVRNWLLELDEATAAELQEVGT